MFSVPSPEHPSPAVWTVKLYTHPFPSNMPSVEPNNSPLVYMPIYSSLSWFLNLTSSQWEAKNCSTFWFYPCPPSWCCPSWGWLHFSDKDDRSHHIGSLLTATIWLLAAIASTFHSEVWRTYLCSHSPPLALHSFCLPFHSDYWTFGEGMAYMFHLWLNILQSLILCTLAGFRSPY